MNYLHKVTNIFQKLWYECDHGAHKPERAHTADAGLDLSVKNLHVVDRCELFERVIYTRYEIDTGVHLFIPKGVRGACSATFLNVTKRFYDQCRSY